MTAITLALVWIIVLLGVIGYKIECILAVLRAKETPR